MVPKLRRDGRFVLDPQFGDAGRTLRECTHDVRAVILGWAQSDRRALL